MPLAHYSLKTINRLLKLIDRDPARTGRVLTLSYPDVIVNRNTLAKIFGKEVARKVPKREDSELSLNWHKAHAITDDVPDTKALFAALGYQMDAIDKVEGRGGEWLHDLSNPLPSGRYDIYDLVFDCITNQCFNVAQAWWNMVQCCRVGGYIVSVTPMTMINQGFWNVSPAAYVDFAEANGLEIVERRAVVGVYTRKAELKLDMERRERGIADDTMNVITMQKTESRDSPVWPMMAKFRRHPKCQIATPRISPL